MLEYDVKIRCIPAGKQTLKVNGKKTLDGYEVYHVESSSEANRFFFTLYPFNNQIDSFIHSEYLYPIHYKKKVRDGGYRGSTSVDFDPIGQTAKVVKNKKKTEVHVPAGVQDELSMIYLLRTRELEVGKDYDFPALIGTRSLNVNVKILRIEKLKTALGTLKTILVKALPRDITMWLTHDSARIPVRIEAKTKIGNLVSVLKESR